jgi:hypothetical protein
MRAFGPRAIVRQQLAMIRIVDRIQESVFHKIQVRRENAAHKNLFLPRRR